MHIYPFFFFFLCSYFDSPCCSYFSSFIQFYCNIYSRIHPLPSIKLVIIILYSFLFFFNRTIHFVLHFIAAFIHFFLHYFSSHPSFTFYHSICIPLFLSPCFFLTCSFTFFIFAQSIFSPFFASSAHFYFNIFHVFIHYFL